MTIVKWLSLLVMIAFFLMAQSSNHKTESTPLERLQAKIDVVSIPNLTPLDLAGQYTNASEELNRLVPPMEAESLFIFPGKTYIFTFVADISPDTISDKGTWSLDGDTLRLESDKDITWKSKRVERRYLAVRRSGHDNEVFLVGIDRQLPYFEQEAKDDPQFMFLLISLKREKTITKAQAGPLRRKLMEEKWRPDFYR
jgi:hypothetical protein